MNQRVRSGFCAALLVAMAGVAWAEDRVLLSCYADYSEVAPNERAVVLLNGLYDGDHDGAKVRQLLVVMGKAEVSGGIGDDGVIRLAVDGEELQLGPAKDGVFYQFVAGELIEVPRFELTGKQLDLYFDTKKGLFDLKELKEVFECFRKLHKSQIRLVK